MSDKALNPATLELTQKIQLHFPRGIRAEILCDWNGAPAELISAKLLELFGNSPVVEEMKRKLNLLHLKPVTSDGRNGHQFIEVGEHNGLRFDDWAKNAMTVGRDAKGNLIVTGSSGVVYKPVVIKGGEFEDNERVTSNIRKVAEAQKLVTPPWWLAPLLREKVSDSEILAMGLDWLIVMHEPITDSDGDPSLLGLLRDVCRCLSASYGYPAGRWNRRGGFVFLAPQE